MQGQRIGYVRVSSFDQNPERQLEGVQVARCSPTRLLARTPSVPSWKGCWPSSARATPWWCIAWTGWHATLMTCAASSRADTTGVRMEFVKEGLKFTGEDSPMANLMLSVMGAFAEFERALIRERQREGIVLAKQRGAYRGRKKSLNSEQIAELKRRVAAGDQKPWWPVTSASAAKPCTSTCGLNPVRHRARKPAGTARCQRRTDTALHVQRNRPVGDPSASRRRESIGLRCAACYLRFPGTFWASMSLRFAPVAHGGRATQDASGKLERVRPARTDTAGALGRAANGFGFKPFTMSHYRQAVHTLTELALQTDKGIVLASALVENLRRQSIILPAMNAIERASAEAITRANRRIYAALTDSLLSPHRQRRTNFSSARTAVK